MCGCLLGLDLIHFRGILTLNFTEQTHCELSIEKTQKGVDFKNEQNTVGHAVQSPTLVSDS